jgi:hypothetical protein
MSNTRIVTDVLMGFIVEAYPIMVHKKQMQDGTRRVMEIIEAVGIQNGTVQANTLYRFDSETGDFSRVHGVSDGLAEILRENGAEKAAVDRFREVKA